MKLFKQIALCYGTVALIGLVLAWLITDNQSLLFRLIVWAGALVILAVFSFIGAVASYLTSQIGWGIFQIVGSVQGKATESPQRKERFFTWFYTGFFCFGLLALAKFTSDFIFAQFTPAYLFLSGALGFADGGMIMILLHRGNRTGSVRLLK